MSFAASAILGLPVRHSRSPLIHSYWLRHYDLSGAYLVYETKPEDLKSRLEDFSRLGLAGANLTMPLKEMACKYIVLDDIAAKLQAVNTVWFDDNRLLGTNTDAAGFLGALNEQAPHWRSYLENAVVLGAGGAAKAIIHALLQAGAQNITIVNRSLERAEDLCRLFGPRLQKREWEKRNEALLTADLLVNTTSLGMMGQPPLDLDLNVLPPTAIVADIVYMPLETALLRDAKAAGLTVVDGLGMLLHQAAPGFSRWFGIMPQVTPELRALIAEGLRS